jgi:predicted GIY-YIG superfamily endonuclease
VVRLRTIPAQIKEWKRDWKINLIEHENRHWLDLYPTLTQ